MPLHKVIKNFCAMQGNEKESYFTKMAIYAKWAWRDLYVNTIFDYRTVIMNVCPPDFTIRIPDDCERVFNVSIIDKHNRKHPLSLNTNINTAKLLCPTVKCSCQCGGQDTLCSVIDTLTTTTQTVMIEGSPYTWTTWMNYDRDGSIQQATPSHADRHFVSFPSECVRGLESFLSAGGGSAILPELQRC